MSKKSVQKKRHTKPCRYFQINKCPHSGDVCDFAHVLAPPGTLLDQSLTMCRYSLSSLCVNGPQCLYQHCDEARSSSHTDWAASPIDPTTSTMYAGYPSYGQVWPPSSFTTSNIPPFPTHVMESILFAPPRSRDSLDTVSNSISSLDSDEMMVMTDDPQYPEHSHSHQSQVRIAEDSPIIHVPPFYPIGGIHPGSNGWISPVAPGTFDWGLAAGAKASEHRLKPNPKPMSKQKALAFKTKPCKFFVTERGCPNGDDCSFLHEEEGRPSSPSISPVKFPTLADDNEEKLFYPVNWRVIGGGVRVGVSKGDDVPPVYDLAELSQASPTHKPQPPPLKISTRQRSNSIPPTPSNPQIRVDQLFSAESPGIL